MCCLFGLIDYKQLLSVKQKDQILSALATVCETRGTDATGIAYNSGGKLQIYKRPVPGQRMRFHVPQETSVVMGHTHMATQGSPKKSWNNHPFPGTVRGESFVLAHNGVLYNDRTLRRQMKLSDTKVETDSYIAVQLLEKKRALNFSSLRDMAELVEDSFTFTVLGPWDDLFIVKGDNPMCLVQFPSLGIYLYASTKEILQKAVYQMHLPSKPFDRINLDCGEILQISPDGTMARSTFDDRNLLIN